MKNEIKNVVDKWVELEILILNEEPTSGNSIHSLSYVKYIFESLDVGVRIGVLI